jgi:hypothetical protein
VNRRSGGGARRVVSPQRREPLPHWLSLLQIPARGGPPHGDVGHPQESSIAGPQEVATSATSGLPSAKPLHGRRRATRQGQGRGKRQGATMAGAASVHRRVGKCVAFGAATTWWFEGRCPEGAPRAAVHFGLPFSMIFCTFFWRQIRRFGNMALFKCGVRSSYPSLEPPAGAARGRAPGGRRSSGDAGPSPIAAEVSTSPLTPST